MTRGTRWILTVVTALVAAAGVALAVTVAVEGRGQSHHDHAELDLHNGLLVTTRTAFRVCVESTPPLTTDAQREPVTRPLRAALDRVPDHPLWKQAYRNARYDSSSAVTWGCPAPKLPDRYDRRTVVGPGLTDDPSPYRIWIYVLDTPTADRVLGTETPAATATAEMMRYGSRGTFPVSAALLIRQTVLADTAATAKYLTEAAGLTSS